MKTIHFIFNEQFDEYYYQRFISFLSFRSSEYLNDINNDCSIAFSSFDRCFFTIRFKNRISIKDVFVFLDFLNENFSAVLKINKLKSIQIKTK